MADPSPERAGGHHNFEMPRTGKSTGRSAADIMRSRKRKPVDVNVGGSDEDSSEPEIEQPVLPSQQKEEKKKKDKKKKKRRIEPTPVAEDPAPEAEAEDGIDNDALIQATQQAEEKAKEDELMEGEVMVGDVRCLDASHEENATWFWEKRRGPLSFHNDQNFTRSLIASKPDYPTKQAGNQAELLIVPATPRKDRFGDALSDKAYEFITVPENAWTTYLGGCMRKTAKEKETETKLKEQDPNAAVEIPMEVAQRLPSATVTVRLNLIPRGTEPLTRDAARQKFPQLAQ